MKKAHFISGIVLSLFVSLHLLNHLSAAHSIATHIELMNVFRGIYQHPLIEPILLFAVLIQIISGIQLLRKKGWKQSEWYQKLHVYSGIYLGFFLLMHTSAILVGRFVLLVDTNFYYGAMVVNAKPYLFFYIPYYFLGALSFFVHIACIIRIKSIRKIGIQKANRRANGWIVLGAVLGIIILWAFTYNVQIPSLYMDLLP